MKNTNIYSNSSNDQHVVAAPSIAQNGTPPMANQPASTVAETLTAEPVWDPQEALQHLSLLFEPGQWFEIQAVDAVLKGSASEKGSTAAGVFWSAQAAVDALTEFFLKYTCSGVRVAHNPLNPALVQPTGSIEPRASFASQDVNVGELRWIVVGCNLKRTAGTNCTDSELRHAREVLERIRAFLRERGFPEPVSVMSGDGGQLLYRADSDVDDTETVRALLESLSARFDNDHVEIDTTLHNASSVSKLAGTRTHNGPHTPERPCRMSYLQGLAGDDPTFIAQPVLKAFIEGIVRDPHGFLQEPLNDVGNASRFLSVYGDDVLYCVNIGCWWLWDGVRWKQTDRHAVRELAAKAMKSFQAVVARLIGESPPNRAHKRLHTFAIDSGNLRRLDAMITIAAGQRLIHEDELDFHPWLLTVKNGTIDLYTGTLLPHDRAHRITKIANVAFDPEARSELWEKHLKTVCGDSHELIAYLQRLAGYCLTGDTSARAFAILHGSGCNGKSVTIETLATLMGDYACHTAPSTFELRHLGNSIPNDQARLRGARLVIVSETNVGVRLDAALLKRVTGSEPLPARFLNHEFFEFLPQFKIIMSTNNKPDLHADDQAVWDRVKLIPFDVRIPEANRDPQLGEKLRSPENRSGILNWLVKGCLDCKKAGLQDPVIVTIAGQEYRDDQDIITEWLESKCFLSKWGQGETLWSESTKLRASYNQWVKENEGQELSERRFKELLRKYDCTPLKSKGHRGWRGIRLRNEVSQYAPNDVLDAARKRQQALLKDAESKAA